MSTPAIDVSQLDKVFRIWKQPSDMLVEALTGKQRHTEFQALRGVSFTVAQGEVLGVMGRNGAGKSTLLRIIAGTLNATAGRVSVAGRIAAILELGTGFHPEYTGRDNIYLGGLCLGLSKADIAHKLEEIIDFAELRAFIDQPFRTYSSGMQARLTFSVATAVDPDVLIVDEALAVGDARFALKSFDRIREFRRRGKSILLVSHDVNQINTICDRAILLERGEVRAAGDPAAVSNLYHEMLFGSRVAQEEITRHVDAAPGDTELRTLAGIAPEASPAMEQSLEDEADAASQHQSTVSMTHEHRYGDGKALLDFHIEDERRRPVTTLRSGETYFICCTVTAREPLSDLCIGVMIRTPRGIEVFGADSSGCEPRTVFSLSANHQARIEARMANHLAPGVYFLTAGVARTDGHKHDMRFDALEFAVEAAPGVYHASLVNLEVSFTASPGDSQQRDKLAAGA